MVNRIHAAFAPCVAMILVLAALPATAVAAGHAPSAAKPAGQTLTVCAHGCVHRTIQSAVDASGRDATILVKPGHYVEGVIVQGHRHDGLTIKGTSADAAKVVLEGRNAHGPEGLAQNGVEADHVNDLTLENLKAEHYATNGFFVNGGRGYLMKNLIAGFNHSYGLYAFRTIGGRMTRSVGYGNGDSAFYVGGTPFEKKPVWTPIDHDTGYENVLGYSGTNSKYIRIEDDSFYNNGAGIVPNTLDSEPYEPSEDGIIEHNQVFWNNFDYYRKGSPVKTVSGGLANGQFNYPIGAGVILFGASGWTVKDNQIFGNFLWGAGAFSDPTNKTGKAMNAHNTFIDNQMGDGGKDPNGVDFFNDGSGTGTCFADNGAGVTYDTSSTDADLYPACPSTAGSGTITGDSTQVLKLLAIAGANPPTDMENYWHVHSHPKRKGVTPYEG